MTGLVLKSDCVHFYLREKEKGEIFMIPNQILQSTIDGLKEISRTEMCVFDADGKALASTFVDSNKYEATAAAFAGSDLDSQKLMGCHYFKIFDESALEYVLMAEGSGEEAHMIGRMAGFQIQNLTVAYKERFDRDNFIKNLLLDNLLLVDIFNRSRKLHIENARPRTVIVIEAAGDGAANLFEAVKSALPAKSDDFVTAVDERNIIVVKEVRETDDYAAAEEAARLIHEKLSSEYRLPARAAYGTIVSELKDVSRSYKEAKMALDVGKIFYEDKNVIAYNNLGIGRLIYQLPVSLCRMFIREIFSNRSPENLDAETLATINKFFENNLNVSETSRQLYIHRNTLVYRLDKLETQTGLDLRVFEDAITFKIALMVVKYMNYIESLES